MTKKAKIKNHYSIIRDHREVGAIKLVYYADSAIPHIEYELEEEYRKKGIMKKELKKYIDAQREEGVHRFIAVVERGNKASIALLDKFNFQRLSDSKDYNYYLACFDIYDQLFKARDEFNDNLKYSMS